MIRTGTGSISVMKIIQKAICFPRKSKKTIAKAERIAMEIFPRLTTTATTALLTRSRPMWMRFQTVT